MSDQPWPYAAEFGPFDGRVWLNTAHQGPLPKAAVGAALAALNQKTRPYLIPEESFFEIPTRLRRVLGETIGADPDDVILGNSTTYGLDLLVNAIPWRVRDEVLLVAGDFPATIIPWLVLRDCGVTVRLIEAAGPAIGPEQLGKEISPRTRLFCTSWVNSFTGHVIDVNSIGEVCRGHGVNFVLNASQALGARLLNVERAPVDVVTCCGFKWLCGPYATGFCWISPDLRERLIPRHAYWLAMQAGRPLGNMREYTLRPDLGARAWDVFCTANFLNFMPWTAAVELLLRIGLAEIAAYDQQLVGRLLDNLDESRFELISPRAEPERSTLVVVRPRGPQSAEQWRHRLSTDGFDVAVREGNLRISPHLHNTAGDINALSAVLAGS